MHAHSAAVAEDCHSVKDVQFAPSGGAESVSVKVNLRKLKSSLLYIYVIFYSVRLQVI